MDDAIGQRLPLGHLLASTVDGVIDAQRALDVDARARLTEIVETPAGAITLPPLWYTISDASITVELAASVTRTGAGQSQRVGLDARLLNPVAVSLFGHSASSGVRVTLAITPREAGTAVPPLDPQTP